ncbi:MAG: class I SAM-dependent methyltransferase [Sphingomonadales bacterium]|nr:class I SAM-dependent methyltransferase [Sphingomonadales bacterium]
MMTRLAFALPFAALCLAAPLAAAPSDYAAVVADSNRLADNRKLDEQRLPAEVMDFAGIKRGDVVADWQAGGGYYTEMLARAVGPKGRVYGVFNSAFFKPDVWAKVTAGRPNVLTLAAPQSALQLAPGSLDMIFTHLTFHDLYLGTNRAGDPLPDPQGVLANWFAALKPGGTVIVADHIGPAGDTTAIAKRLHRIDPEAVKREMARAGFVSVAESGVLHRSEDAHELGVFDPSLRGHTDRMLLKFRRP